MFPGSKDAVLTANGNGSPSVITEALSGAPYFVPDVHSVVEVRMRNPQSESKSNVSEYIPSEVS